MGGLLSCIASTIAFRPPSPQYNLIKDDATGLLLMEGFRRRHYVEVFKIPTRRDTEIVAVYVRCPMATTTLLFSHQNAVDLKDMYSWFRELSSRLRLNVLGYDYSGYGQSTGKPSENNTYADIEAAYKCLEERYGAKQEDVILYGQSVGSGPTVDLAARLPRLKAVVLHSPIASGLRVMYPVKRTYWFDIYKNVDKIPLVRCPVLIIHGTADDVVDCSHGKLLWEHCQEKYEPLWIKGGNHCDLEHYPEYIKHLKKFIATVEKPPSQRNISRKSTDQSRRSVDKREKPPRRSTDKSEKLRFHEFKFGHDDKLSKLKASFEQVERSRRSVEFHEKSRMSSVDEHFDKGRKSVDWVDRLGPF